jgi:hypothetical protein
MSNTPYFDEYEKRRTLKESFLSKLIENDSNALNKQFCDVIYSLLNRSSYITNISTEYLSNKSTINITIESL